MDELKPGARIGEFTVVTVLGVTAVGRQYRASAPITGVPVDLLCHAPQLDAADGAARGRDVDALLGVSIPGLVSVLGHGVQDGLAYLATEPVPGRSLTDVLVDGPLGIAALTVLRPVATALDALHDRGILHRQLTPNAVVVEPSGAGRLRFPAPPQASSAADSTVENAAAPPVYLAPEQAGGRLVSHRTDLYSFGCLAFHAVTGRPAFTLATLLDQTQGSVPTAASTRQDLPVAALDAVFARALAVRPTERPPSATALMDALSTAFGVRARPSTAGHSRRWGWIGAVAGLAMILATSAAFLSAPAPANPADPAVRFAVAADPLPVGAGPADLEVGAGYVWVTGADDGSLTRIEPDTGTTTRCDIGGEPGQMVATDDAVWVRNHSDSFVRVDPRTGVVSAPVQVGRPISGLAVGAGYVWLTHRAEGTVSRVDARTLAPVGEPIVVGAEPRLIEFDGDAVYVLRAGDGSLARIDARSATLTGTVDVGESVGGVEVDRGVVYVAADGGVVPVRQDTLAVDERFIFDGWSYFEVADGTMWVVFDEAAAIRRFDPATRMQIGDPVPGVGAEVGKARYGHDRLWLTVPERNEVLQLAPAD